MANPAYASQGFLFTWNTISLNTGWGTDQFLTVAHNGPLKELTFGADGSMTTSQLADQGGVINMTFMQTAKALTKIDEISAAEQLVGAAYVTPYSGLLTFTDPLNSVNSFVAYNTTLLETGSHEHAKVVGERTITWGCEKLIYGNVSSILANISSYIKS